MKITNKFGVPETLVAAITKDYYSKGKADYSVTEIISPPRIQILRRRHWNEMEVDVTELLWQFMGKAIHSIAEHGVVVNHITEERLYYEVNGVTLSGAIDLQHLQTDNTVNITDYKFTSVWALRADKDDWHQQQNIYKHIVEQVKGLPVSGLNICAFLRDWSKRESQVKADYPQAQIQMVALPLWTPDKALGFIKERIELHRDAKVAADWGSELPPCTEEDRWQRDTKYAVLKEGGKRALRVFDTEAEAQELQKATPKTVIMIRKGEAVRCVNNYCNVNQWCTQYQKAQQEAQDE